jgi:hypothetical protein
MFFPDDMTFKHGRRPVLADGETQRLKFAVKCKPGVSLDAEISFDERDDAVVARIYKDPQCHNLFRCGGAERHIGIDLPRVHGKREYTVAIRAAWMSKNGNLSGIRKIFANDLRPDEYRISTIEEILERHPYVRAVHAAKAALFALPERYTGPRATHRFPVPLPPRPNSDKALAVSAVLGKRVFFHMMGPTAAQALTRQIQRFGGMRSWTDLETASAGDVVVVGNSCPLTEAAGAKVVRLSQFREYAAPRAPVAAVFVPLRDPTAESLPEPEPEPEPDPESEQEQEEAGAAEEYSQPLDTSCSQEEFDDEWGGCSQAVEEQAGPCSQYFSASAPAFDDDNDVDAALEDAD